MYVIADSSYNSVNRVVSAESGYSWPCVGIYGVGMAIVTREEELFFQSAEHLSEVSRSKLLRILDVARKKGLSIGKVGCMCTPEERMEIKNRIYEQVQRRS